MDGCKSNGRKMLELVATAAAVAAMECLGGVAELVEVVVLIRRNKDVKS